ncbi:23230_t:CDS:1, partial [Gigaspora margarita]
KKKMIIKKLLLSLHDSIEEKEKKLSLSLYNSIKEKGTIIKKLSPSLYNSIKEKENNCEETITKLPQFY